MVCRYYRLINPKTHHSLQGNFSPDDLRRLNAAGYNVYRQLNYHHPLPQGQFVTTADVVSIRSFFIDCDGSFKEVGQMIIDLGFPEPSLAIFTGSENSGHYYWILVQPSKRLWLFTPIQKALAKLFETDTKVCDLPRIVRVPGFINHKSGKRASIVSNSGKRYQLNQLVSEVSRCLGRSVTSNQKTDRGKNIPFLPLPKSGGDTYQQSSPRFPDDDSYEKRWLPRRLIQMIASGLEKPRTRTARQLRFIHICHWAGLRRQHSYRLWVQLLLRHRENSNEVAINNWQLIESEFRRCWSTWHRKANDKYKCYNCGLYFPASAFSKDRSRSSGLASRCRKCDSVHRVEIRRRKREKDRLTSQTAKPPGDIKQSNATSAPCGRTSPEAPGSRPVTPITGPNPHNAICGIAPKIPVGAVEPVESQARTAGSTITHTFRKQPEQMVVLTEAYQEPHHRFCDASGISPIVVGMRGGFRGGNE